MNFDLNRTSQFARCNCFRNSLYVIQVSMRCRILMIMNHISLVIVYDKFYITLKKNYNYYKTEIYLHVSN